MDGYYLLCIPDLLEEEIYSPDQIKELKERCKELKEQGEEFYIYRLEKKTIKKRGPENEN